MASGVVVKMSVNFAPEVIRALRELSRRRGVSMTEVLRQAIGTEVYLDKAMRSGGHVLVEDRHGKVREMVFR